MKDLPYIRETLKKAGYQYIKYLGNKEHKLFNVETGIFELFTANKNYAGWCLIYKNTHLEFCCSLG